MTATLPVSVLNAANAVAADHRIDRSTLLTDIVCFHYGRPDLMRHLPQQLLFESRPSTNTADDGAIGPHAKVRLPLPIAELVDRDHEQLGIQRSTYLADIICRHMGFPHLVRELDKGIEKEVLPLAI
ncbi:hypothetical protein [Mycolicibacterium mageritense]|uniref:hypothetical protein n=1 Tax=Mycolicibacterium mageritense TaxID=53462 RepID=UPI001E29187F|nr:hypothetical protein [Mycolicibacterium mageritense]GJJ24006.1 hypothetical protein MTY414_76800 [Mycolicibacterium mageritense]